LEDDKAGPRVATVLLYLSGVRCVSAAAVLLLLCRCCVAAAAAASAAVSSLL